MTTLATSGRRLEDLKRFYALLGSLKKYPGFKTLNKCDGYMNWPRRGVYFFFDKEEQRVAWHKVYRRMQVVYHGGLVLGIVAAYFLASGFCAAQGKSRSRDIGAPRYLDMRKGKK